jgi:hypothetical protein
MHCFVQPARSADTPNTTTSSTNIDSLGERRSLSSKHEQPRAIAQAIEQALKRKIDELLEKATRMLEGECQIIESTTTAEPPRIPLLCLDTFWLPSPQCTLNTVLEWNGIRTARQETYSRCSVCRVFGFISP